MNDHLVTTIPNHHLTKIDVLPKTFVQIILAAKWLGRHSSTYTSSNKQQRPLPFSSIVILLLCRILPHLYTNTPFSYYLLYSVYSTLYIVQIVGRCEVGAMAVPRYDRRALLAAVRHGTKVSSYAHAPFRKIGGKHT